MATGILGTADLSAAANTTVYTVPADTFAVITVNVTNRNSASRDGTGSNISYWHTN